MSDCRDYREILQGESLDSSDNSSDWEEISETLGSQVMKHLEAKIPGLHLKVVILVKILF